MPKQSLNEIEIADKDKGSERIKKPNGLTRNQDHDLHGTTSGPTQHRSRSWKGGNFRHRPDCRDALELHPRSFRDTNEFPRLRCGGSAG